MRDVSYTLVICTSMQEWKSSSLEKSSVNFSHHLTFFKSFSSDEINPFAVCKPLFKNHESCITAYVDVSLYHLNHATDLKIIVQSKMLSSQYIILNRSSFLKSE